MLLRSFPASRFHPAVTITSFERFGRSSGSHKVTAGCRRKPICFAKVESAARNAAPVEIFTSSELARYLERFGELAPLIALGAFAGLRSAELLRLDVVGPRTACRLHRSRRAQGQNRRSPHRADLRQPRALARVSHRGTSARVWPQAKDSLLKSNGRIALEAGDHMETKRVSPFVHQLSACRNSGREPRCTGSGQFTDDDLPPLPRTRDPGTGEDLVRDRAGPIIKHCANRQAEVYSVKH